MFPAEGRKELQQSIVHVDSALAQRLRRPLKIDRIPQYDCCCN
jgi:hypothetical protein